MGDQKIFVKLQCKILQCSGQSSSASAALNYLSWNCFSQQLSSLAGEGVCSQVVSAHDAFRGLSLGNRDRSSSLGINVVIQ